MNHDERSDRDPQAASELEAQLSVRELLRGAPTDTDAGRRERAIQRALAEFDAERGRFGPTGSTGTRRPRTRFQRTARPLLTAAAVVAVIAAGATVLSQAAGVGGSGDESADSTTADSTTADSTTADSTTAESTTEGATSSGADDRAGSGGDAAVDVPGFSSSELSEDHASGAPPDEGAAEAHRNGSADQALASAAAAGLIELGEQPDADAVLDAASEPRHELYRASQEWTGDAQVTSCTAQLLSRGWSPFAVATIDGVPVLVTRIEGGRTVVVSSTDCSELARR